MRRFLQTCGAATAAVMIAAGGSALAAYGEPPELLAEPYIATADNTLHDIAIVFDLGFVELVAANPNVDPWTPGEGTRVQLPTRHLLPDAPRKGLIVNVGDQRAYLFKKDGEVESFPIGIGREGWSIPIGSTRITRKREHPTWTPPKSIREEKPDLPAVVEAGPDNPLGDYALNLGFPSYLLHGTNKPDGVGRRVSHGCIRFYPWDIEYLFQQVEVGTPVQVVDQPVKLELIDGELYLEVHPQGKQLDEIEESGRFTPLPIPDFEQLILAKAGDQAPRIDWQRATRAANERSGLPVRITGDFGTMAERSEANPETVQEVLRTLGPPAVEPPTLEKPASEAMASTPEIPALQQDFPGNSGGPLSLTERPPAPRAVETARDREEERREPGAGIW